MRLCHGCAGDRRECRLLRGVCMYLRQYMLERLTRYYTLARLARYTLGLHLATSGSLFLYSSTPSTIFSYSTSSADSGPAPWTKKKQKISAYSTGSSKLYE